MSEEPPRRGVIRSAWRNNAEPPATRASDAEREAAVIRLRESCVEGRLTLDEFTERMGAAYEAATHADLDGLTRDLPARPPSPLPDAKRTIIGVLGSGNQRGRWQVAKQTTLVACLGHCDIDLGSAVITDSEVTLRAFAMLGSVRVTIPSGVNVIVDGSSILGSTDVRLDRSGPPPPPGAPTIRIRAYTLLGSAEVIGRRPKLLDRLRETRERWRGGAR